MTIKRDEEGKPLISVYTDAQATATEIAEGFNKLMYAYPSLNKMDDDRMKGFMKVFAEAVRYAGMTGEQLKDAVMNCITRKHQYGELQIADITSYGIDVHMHDYKWFTENSTHSACVNFNGFAVWVDSTELAIKGYRVVNRKIVKL